MKLSSIERKLFESPFGSNGSNIILTHGPGGLMDGSSHSWYSFWTQSRATFQVPADKQLRVLGMKGYCSRSSTGIASITVGYGDAPASGTSAPAGFVHLAYPEFKFSASFEYNERPTDIIIPAGKYPYLKIGMGDKVRLTGIYCTLENL